MITNTKRLQIHIFALFNEKIKIEKKQQQTLAAFFSCSAICRCRLLVSRNSTRRKMIKAGN